ncbi:MAG: hypothetical protein Q4F84_08625, partial [Fibrobacter sp.]|nr:hypothetical protein [Fibrobacter sp.]
GKCVAADGGFDGAAKCAGIFEVGSFAVSPFLPLLAKETAAREVLIKLFGKLYFEVLEDGFDDVHFCLVFSD